MSSQGARRRLGTLLKAKILVILRASEKQIEGEKIHSLRIVIADTSTGLRILVRVYLWDENQAEDTARKIVHDIRLAQAKMKETIRAIVAVPPFVNDDFTYRYATMQEAYAEIIRQSLIRIQGIVLVELEEANTITN